MNEGQENVFPMNPITNPDLAANLVTPVEFDVFCLIFGFQVPTFPGSQIFALTGYSMGSETGHI